MSALLHETIKRNSELVQTVSALTLQVRKANAAKRKLKKAAQLAAGSAPMSGVPDAIGTTACGGPRDDDCRSARQMLEAELITGADWDDVHSYTADIGVESDDSTHDEFTVLQEAASRWNN